MVELQMSLAWRCEVSLLDSFYIKGFMTKAGCMVLVSWEEHSGSEGVKACETEFKQLLQTHKSLCGQH